MIKKYKNRVLTLIALMIIFIITACSNNENANQPIENNNDDYEEATIRLAYNLSADHHISKGIENFAKTVTEKSGGKVKINTYPAGQLLSDKEMNQALLTGGVEMGLNGTTLWTSSIPEIGIFDVPFTFPTYEIAHKALKGEVRDKLNEKMEAHGAKVLMYADFGYNQVINSDRAITKPEDFGGLKIRTIGEIWSVMLQSFGANPVNMGAGEVYMALQTGVIDGATTGIQSMVDRKLYEVGKYITINNYSYLQFLLSVNKEYWDQLPPKTQELIMTTAQETEDWIREQTQKADSEALDQLVDLGMEVYTVTEDEFPIWREQSKPAWDLYLKNTGEMGQELIDYINSLQ